MEWIGKGQDILPWLKKHGLVFLVFAVGILLMLLPEGNQSAAPVTQTVSPEPEASLEQRLEALLSRVDGAGKVRVLLSEATGEEILYQTDRQQEKSQTEQSQQWDTVRITGSDRAESGLIRRIDPPVYQGAVVLCQGAGSASLRLAIVDAVSAATGLTSDKISVLKMK